VISAELILRAPESLLVVVSASLVLSLGYAAIAYALTRTFPIRPKLDDQRGVMRLTAVVTLGALVTGTSISGRAAGGIGTPSRSGSPAQLLGRRAWAYSSRCRC
jgi:hypothetical protein